MSAIAVTADGGTTVYRYKYDFKKALSDDGTIIRPPLPSSPTALAVRNENGVDGGVEPVGYGPT